MLTPRDERIAQDIVRIGALTTSQVARAHFPRMASSQRMAQRRLLALREAKRLDRRAQVRGDYVWLPARSRMGDIDHRLMIAQAWVELSTPRDFWTEYTLGPLRADALFWLGSRAFLLEVERSHNDLARKLARYTDAWRDKALWREQFAEFPYLLLIVPSPAHVERAAAMPSPPKTVCTIGSLARSLPLPSTPARSTST